ncbi:hypothetical protein C2G38_2210626 [Gigaspora rosea]|uniref:Uncharacterized protein n=1 Tax=Gigaspora rosea TaxID=44941 RepID=A0A397UJ58_9GLOM|nr:hypothetical protein C2G38_2210626 [Gigaspora rosea]
MSFVLDSFFRHFKSEFVFHSLVVKVIVRAIVGAVVRAVIGAVIGVVVKA